MAIKKQFIAIENIPAILWGERSENLFIAVHGDMSHKEDKVIEILADEATLKGSQVLSFDLPEHGDRKNNSYLCKVQNCVHDLTQIINYARQTHKSQSLFACSMGAYFSLLSYYGHSLNKAMFLSPIVDMERIIHYMMNCFGVSEEQLKLEGEIALPIGKTLYWDYFTYVKSHPIIHWPIKTSVFYGENDSISEYEIVRNFCDKFNCHLSQMKNGEHFFHTPDQLAFFRNWLRNNL